MSDLRANDTDDAIILAAGKGTRMKSQTAKVLHPILGRPMLQHVLQSAEQAGFAMPIVVLAPDAADVRAMLPKDAKIAIQAQQCGTGDATRVAMDVSQATGDVLILYGDVPLLRPQTLDILRRQHKQQGVAATVLTMRQMEPTGYGRIVRDQGGSAVAIVEERDASEAVKTITEVNTGIYVFKSSALRQQLAGLTAKNAQGEYYLPDTIAQLVAAGESIGTMMLEDETEAMGINDRVQLAEATNVLRHRVLTDWMRAGVTVVDPNSTFVDVDVMLAADVVIEPFTRLCGNCVVEGGATIGAQSQIFDSQIAKDASIIASVVEQSVVGERSYVGPFAHLRSGCVVHHDVHIGNYAELKNTEIGAFSKAHHHTYLGDATIGQRVNIGAGTVIVNYDGKDKFRTQIGDDAFIGCNANLVAPLTIAKTGYVGAGSTITKNVPEGALAIARSRQENLDGWVTRKRRPKGE